MKINCNEVIIKHLRAYKNNTNKEMEAPRKVWIFHHTDADGYCGGFICKSYAKIFNFETYACDYTTDFSRYDIEKNDMVMIVDLSFTDKTIYQLKDMAEKCNNRIMWIDHHESSVDCYDNDKELQDLDFLLLALGDRENKYSAAFLAYVVLTNVLNPKVDIITVPQYVYLVSDWDTWSHETKDSKYFNKGVNCSPYIHLYSNQLERYDNHNIWELLNEEFIRNSCSTQEELISKGKLLVEENEVLDARYLKSNGFEFNLFGYRILACNQRSNSLLFGDRIYEYDFVCPFVLHRRNGKLIYTYSLFSTDDELSCKELAERFGGGGHKGAAGFQLPFNIFTTKNLRLRLFLHNLKNKLTTKK